MSGPAARNGFHSAGVSRPALRHAFTLVELLAVIAIIGLLVALLLPAIQSARETARRVSCANNLRQIATGVASYESQNGVLPFSTPECAPDADKSELARLGLFADGISWMVRLLPFIEQAALANATTVTGHVRNGLGLKTSNAGLRAALVTIVPIYYCASDNAVGKTRSDIGTWESGCSLGGISFAVSNYAGVIGPTDINSTVSLPGISPYCNIRTGENPPNTCPGSFWRHNARTPVRLASFRDGTSTTQIAGERVPELTTFATWATANTAHAYHAMGLNFVDPSAFKPDGTPKYAAPSTMGFASRHAGGGFFAYADGHVGFVDDLVAINVYYAMSTRNGGAGEPPVPTP